ncbi:MAG: hypothetical protein U0792_12460 [Gemmataceae bacterium]
MIWPDTRQSASPWGKQQPPENQVVEENRGALIALHQAKRAGFEPCRVAVKTFWFGREPGLDQVLRSAENLERCCWSSLHHNISTDPRDSAKEYLSIRQKFGLCSEAFFLSVLGCWLPACQRQQVREETRQMSSRIAPPILEPNLTSRVCSHAVTVMRSGMGHLLSGVGVATRTELGCSFRN